MLAGDIAPISTIYGVGLVACALANVALLVQVALFVRSAPPDMRPTGAAVIAVDTVILALIVLRLCGLVGGQEFGGAFFLVLTLGKITRALDARCRRQVWLTIVDASSAEERRVPAALSRESDDQNRRVTEALDGAP